MKSDKIQSAAELLQEVRKLLLEAGVAPNGRFVRQIEDLGSELDLFARFMVHHAA